MGIWKRPDPASAAMAIWLEERTECREECGNASV